MAARSDPDLLPEPDRLADAPHPRMTERLFGQEAAEAAFLAAWNSGRLHHGWLLTGPRGIGKATLAWRIARFLLGQPEQPAASLDSPADNALAKRLQALAEPRLFLLRRGLTDKGDALAREISVGEVRRLHAFLALRAVDGGRRVVIVDAADEMNPQAANALLKLLEEPPADTTLLLIAHQPGRLLPTIRSRCQTLPLAPLAPDALAAALAGAGVAVTDPVALAALAGGSAAAAIELLAQDGLALYAELVGLMAQLPRLDRQRVLALANAAGGRGTEGRFALTLDLVDLLLARLARTGAMGQPPAPATPDEAAVLTRLAPDARAARHWAELAQTLGQRARAGRAVNLDPAALVLDTLLRIETAARGLGT